MKSETVEQFLARGGEIKKCAPDPGAQMKAYIREQVRLASLHRHSGARAHRSRSIFFRKGEGSL